MKTFILTEPGQLPLNTRGPGPALHPGIGFRCGRGGLDHHMGTESRGREIWRAKGRE